MIRAAFAPLLLALCVPLLLGAAPAAKAKAPAKPPPAGKASASSKKTVAPAMTAAAKEPPPPVKAEVTVEDVELARADKQRAIVERLLKSLSKQSGEEGLSVLQGGASLVSRIYALDDWAIVGREKRRIESGDFAQARKLLAALDLERKKANRELVAAPQPVAGKANDVAMSGVGAVDDAWTFELARESAKLLFETHPVLGFLLGADREEFGYANDPFRKMLAKAPKGGKYTVELDPFTVQTHEGHHEKVPRKFPVYVFRLKAGRFDSGYKVLPTTETTGASAAEVCR